MMKKFSDNTTQSDNLSGTTPDSMDSSGTKEVPVSRESSSQESKLRTIGSLAAGIAHEINTPTQYIGDNTRFLEDAFNELEGVLKIARDLALGDYGMEDSPDRIIEAVLELRRSAREIDFDYL
jgi:signal transduction histidine kinase